MWHRVKCAFIVIGLLTLSACASQPLLQQQACPLARLATLQLPPMVQDAALRRVMNHDDDKMDADILAGDRQQIEKVVGSQLHSALDQASIQTVVEIVSAPAARPDQVGKPVDAPALAALQALHPADAYLRWRVTDYGETPVRWKGAYVTFEVVTTLAIAGAFYAHKVTRPVAGIYLLEEGAEEFSEGYAGFWALNRLSRPVRIEADLIDGHTGSVIWSDSETGLAWWRWHNLWHMDDAAQVALLNTSARKATAGMARNLQNHLSESCGKLACTANGACY